MANVTTTIHDGKNNTQRRRELFPTNGDDSDELGHISPLSNNSTPPDSPSKSSYYTDKLIEQNIKNFSKSTIADYVILENICTNNDKENSFVIKTPLNNRHCEPNENTMSPLYVSPMINSNVTSSPKKFAESVYLTKSPSFALKTPQSTSVINLDVPKLVRKSPLKSSSNLESGKRKMPFSESPSANKHPKLDPGSKVRTVLFPKSDLVVPTTSFYAKSNPTYVPHTFKNVNLPTKRINLKSTSLFLCRRKGNSKKIFGQINAGVKHKIRKPKPKKKHDSQTLTGAFNLVNHLNDIFPKFDQKTCVSIPHINEEEMQQVLDVEIAKSKKRERSPSPDPNKKFFKFKRSTATVTVDKHLKLEMNAGKLTIVENKKSIKKHKAANVPLKVNLDATDLIVPDNESESLISPEKIDNILFTLDKANNVVQDINMDKEIPEDTEQFVLQAHNSVAMSENAIHLHKEDSIIDKSILLSPTSQMCNMTSGLALNSPKKAIQNITNILTGKNNKPESLNEEISFASEMEQRKLFPIFSGGSNKVPTKNVKTPKIQNLKKFKALHKDQMLLDAGQKKFGGTQCSECKFVYHMGDPNDELLHRKYHYAENILRFNGWKDENVMAQFSNARIIRVLPCHPKPWVKKVKDLLEVINRDLGYYEMEVNLNNSQVFLYIKQRTIAGCLVAEAKSTAYRMLSDNLGIDLCSEKSYPIKCGISRIWVSQTCRNEGIATSLVNSLRCNFVFGSILTKDDIALSSPTEAGKAFAVKYFNSPNFLVYG